MSVETLTQSLRKRGIYTFEEAAEILEISIETLRGWQKKKDKPHLQRLFHKVEDTGSVFFNYKRYFQQLIDSADEAAKKLAEAEAQGII